MKEELVASIRKSEDESLKMIQDARKEARVHLQEIETNHDKRVLSLEKEFKENQKGVLEKARQVAKEKIIQINKDVDDLIGAINSISLEKKQEFRRFILKKLME